MVGVSFRQATAMLITVLMGMGTPAASQDAADLAQPTGSPLLTVSGSITVTNHEDTAQFDRDMLEALGEVTIETTTLWTDGIQVFTGVALYDLMLAVGVDPAEDGTLRATALNDYAIDIPLSDARAGFALVAYDRNGRPMSVRDKGPLWIIYPFDDDQKFKSETYYSRSIWQLDRLEVLR